MIKDNNISIIGLDIGNITTIGKSDDSEVIFESRIQAFNGNTLIEQDVFEVEGEKYWINRGNFENDIIKYKKSNFKKLVSYAIGKIAKKKEVNIVASIPAGQFNLHKDKYRSSLLSMRNIETVINGEFKRIFINDVMIVPEGYPIYKLTRAEKLIQGIATIVIDIGGNTTDLTEFSPAGKFVEGKSIRIGLYDVYLAVRELLSDFSITDIDMIQEYVDGERSFVGIDRSYVDIARDSIFNMIYNDIKGLYPSIANYNIILCGGGAKLFSNEFTSNFPQVITEYDIALNAKGSQLIGEKKWQKRE